MKSTAQFNAFHKGQHRSRAGLATPQAPIPDATRSLDEVSKLFGSPDDLGKRVMDGNIALGARLRGEGEKKNV